MHRIDDYGNVAGMFTEGDPGQAIPATKVTDAWLNAVQEEIIGVLTAAGVAPVKANNAQLAAAISARISTLISSHDAVVLDPHGATPEQTPERIVVRDATGRARFADPITDDDAATKGYVTAAAPPVGKVVAAGSTIAYSTPGPITFDAGVYGVNAAASAAVSAGEYRIRPTVLPTNPVVIVTRATGVGGIRASVNGSDILVNTFDAAGSPAAAFFSFIILQGG